MKNNIFNTTIIDNYLKIKQCSKWALCKKSGVPYHMLKCIYAQNPTCSLRRVAKLVFYMGYELEDIIIA